MARVAAIVGNVSQYRGGNNSRRVLSELYAMLKPPALQHFISEDAVQRLNTFIKRPFAGTQVNQRALDMLTSSFAATTKAFHSGKGDDYESVAMVFGNPAAPISLSSGGFLSPVPGSSRSPEILDAMKKYGGHFITTNLDVGLDSGIPPQYKLDEKTRELGNKGNTYVQVDYTIIIPANISNNGKIKIFLIEFKAGESHLNIAIDEAYQLRKAKKLYQMWWGEKNVDVTMIYHPFLSGRANFNPKLRNRHSVADVIYVNFEGIVDFLKLDEDMARNIGTLRGNLVRRVGGSAWLLGEFAKKRIKEQRIAQRALEKTLAIEFEQGIRTNSAVVNKAIHLGNVTLINALANQGKTINNVFAPSASGAGRLLLNTAPQNLNWKTVSEQLIFLLVKREQIKPKLLTLEAPAAILELYLVTKDILAKDNGRILRDAVKAKLLKFTQDVETVFRNLPTNSGNTTLQFKKDYFIQYIKIRSELLGKAAANYSINSIDPRDRIIVSEEKAAADLAAGAANAIVNKAISNMNSRNALNVNYTNVFKQVITSNANSEIKKIRLEKIFKALTAKFDISVVEAKGRGNISAKSKNIAGVRNAVSRMNLLAKAFNQKTEALMNLGQGVPPKLGRGALYGNVIRYGNSKTKLNTELKKLEKLKSK